VIEDYADALVVIQALREYAFTVGSAEIPEPDVEARRLRVHQHVAEVQNSLFAIHWDLSRLEKETSDV